MNPEPNPASAGYVPRLLSAAAFLTRRATDESLTELRLTRERTAILGILSRTQANAAALSAASGLEADCVHDCVLALECCGYASKDQSGTWWITPAGREIQIRADEAERQLMSNGNHDADGLRQELQELIRALTPPPSGPPPAGPHPG